MIARLIPLLQHPAVRRVLVILYSALLTVLLIQPSSQPIIGAPAPPGPPDLAREILLTCGHIVTFALLTCLWTWTFASRLPLKRALLLAVGVGLALGVVTELAQTLVADRQASWWDIGVNSAVTLLSAWGIARRYD